MFEIHAKKYHDTFMTDADGTEVIPVDSEDIDKVLDILKSLIHYYEILKIINKHKPNPSCTSS